jgi:hypothetical protein
VCVLFTCIRTSLCIYIFCFEHQAQDSRRAGTHSHTHGSSLTRGNKDFDLYSITSPAEFSSSQVCMQCVLCTLCVVLLCLVHTLIFSHSHICIFTPPHTHQLTSAGLQSTRRQPRSHAHTYSESTKSKLKAYVEERRYEFMYACVCVCENGYIYVC